MNTDLRLKRIEEKIGVGEEKRYWFYILNYKALSERERKIIGCYRQDEACRCIIIWEMKGKQFIRQIDSNSEEGKKILQEHGYQQTNDAV